MVELIKFAKQVNKENKLQQNRPTAGGIIAAPIGYYGSMGGTATFQNAWADKFVGPDVNNLKPSDPDAIRKYMESTGNTLVNRKNEDVAAEFGNNDPEYFKNYHDTYRDSSGKLTHVIYNDYNGKGFNVPGKYTTPMGTANSYAIADLDNDSIQSLRDDNDPMHQLVPADELHEGDSLINVGANASVPILAHEFGHTTQRFPGMYPLYSLGQAAPLATTAGTATSIAFGNRNLAKKVAIGGSLASLGMLGIETHASLEGASHLDDWHDKIKAFSGVPTYAALTALPLAAYYGSTRLADYIDNRNKNKKGK